MSACEWINKHTSQFTWGQWDVHTSHAALTWHHILSSPAVDFSKTLVPVFLHLVLCHCVFGLPCAWFLCSHDPTPFALLVLCVYVLTYFVCFIFVLFLANPLLLYFIRSVAFVYFGMLCVCSSGAAQWSGAKHKLETRRIPAGFFLQGNDNLYLIEWISVVNVVVFFPFKPS